MVVVRGRLRGGDGDVRRLTTEDFVGRARAVHGDRYDYSLVEYRGNGVKVRIVCPVHGEFSQTPAKHVIGHGCPHVECVNARRAATTRAHFGVDNPARAPAVRAAMAATCLERYGVENPMSSPEIRARLRASVREKYGVDCSFQAPSVMEKRERTLVARYGGNSPMCDPAVRARKADTMRRVYGVEHALQSPGLRARAAATSLSHYGAANPMRDESVRARVVATKRARGTFCSSSPEETLFGMLCEIFGRDDVVRQYRSDVYPFACDFYVRSRNLYVELNASWTHGGHWFDASDDSDAAVLTEWRERADAARDGRARPGYYDNAIHVWTDADVRKREAARSGGLNYVVFWDNELRDAAVWFERGCPDGRDWDELWSWFDADSDGEAYERARGGR